MCRSMDVCRQSTSAWFCIRTFPFDLHSDFNFVAVRIEELIRIRRDMQYNPEAFG